MHGKTRMHHFKVFIPHNSNYASGIITGEYYTCHYTTSVWFKTFGEVVWFWLQQIAIFSFSSEKHYTTSTCSLHFNCIIAVLFLFTHLFNLSLVLVLINRLTQPHRMLIEYIYAHHIFVMSQPFHNLPSHIPYS